MNDLEIKKLIKDNFFEMIKFYESKSKSDFWEKFFKKTKIFNIDKIDLSNFRKPKRWGSKLSSGMDDDFGFFYTMSVYIDLLDSCKKNDIKDYVELGIGNPTYYQVGDLKINHHEVTTVNLLNRVSKFISEERGVVCEIGAGFGSLVSKLKKKHTNLNFILFDLPEAIILQSYYLMKLFPNAKFCFYNDFKNLTENELLENNYDFIILPSWSINKIKKTEFIDFFINTHSFQEMDKKVVDSYFAFIHTTIKKSGVFYCLNKYSKTINNTAVRISEYPYDNNWEVLNFEKGWKNENMHEIIVKRSEKKDNKLKELLNDLPKSNPSVYSQSLNNYIKLILRKIMNFFMFFIPKKILLKILKMYL